MSWNNNDGPWGPSGGKPSSGKAPDDKTPPWARNKPSSGGSPPGGTPPELEEILRKLRAWLEPFKPRGHFQAFVLALAALSAIWLLSGFYQVSADQLGVVMRFGAFARTEMPGLRYHLPTPFEEALLPTVTAQNEIQIGFRRYSRNDEDMRLVPEEGMMLTGDENVINVEFTVFWRVNDVGKFLFEIRDPEYTIKMAAESVMREVIGQNKLQFALTEGRSQIADEARTRLQALMDEYNAGIVVSQINLQTVSVPDEVKEAFQDVVNARLDQERFQNQAEAHVNQVIPDAKGKAAQMVQQAMAYRDQKIAIAKGEADRFKSVLAAYDLNREVTARRLYLETMEATLGHAPKIIIDKAAGGGTIPYFPLQELRAKAADKNGDAP